MRQRLSIACGCHENKAAEGMKTFLRFANCLLYAGRRLPCGSGLNIVAHIPPLWQK